MLIATNCLDQHTVAGGVALGYDARGILTSPAGLIASLTRDNHAYAGAVVTTSTGRMRRAGSTG